MHQSVHPLMLILFQFLFHFVTYRTLKIRVLQQSQTATSLVSWLAQAAEGKEHDGIPADTVYQVRHASLQKVTWDIQRQFPGGYGATFSVLVSYPQSGFWQLRACHNTTGPKCYKP